MDRIDRKLTALRQTKLFGSLDDDDLGWLASRSSEKRYASGQMLFFAGEMVTGMFVVMYGTVRVFQQNADGREQVMHVDNAGATIADVAIFDGEPYPASAIADADVEVLFIDKGAIHELCIRTPMFALAALKLMAARVRRHAQLIGVLSFHEVGQRLALFLLGESEKLCPNQSGRVSFQLAMSNHEVATHIGSVRDVVSRALVRLQELGLIARKARGVTIISVPALRAYAHSTTKATASKSKSLS